MPRDFSRRLANSALRDRVSSPVTAFSAFSALVAVSVAVSSGMTPGADAGQGSAFGAAAASAEQSRGGGRLLAAGQELSRPPAAPARDGRSASPVRDGGAGDGAWREGAGRGDGSRSTLSTVRPGRHAPRLYEGELPVNTIIAPTSPGAVLHGGAFGWRIAPDRGGREFHNGTDVSAAAGLPVVAALKGEVTAVFWDVWGGNRVEVTHADGLRTTYSHLEDVRVQVGDRLAASEQLGAVGATGVRVTGPHLHFETWVNGQAVDPQSFDWVDGMRVVPASRSKYSLEVPVPDPAASPAPKEPTKDVAEKQAAERKATERKAAEQEADEHKTAKWKAAEQKAAEQKAAEQKAAEQKAAEQKAAEQKAAEREAAGKADPNTGRQVPAPNTEPKSTPSSPPKPEVPEEKTVVPDADPAPEYDVPQGETAPPGARPVESPTPDAVIVPDETRDTDGDGVLDVVDPDLDGDDTPNELDDDVDGDEKPNDVDDDIDGDGLLNEIDPDIDGDGEFNATDEEPGVPAAMAASAQKSATAAAVSTEDAQDSEEAEDAVEAEDAERAEGLADPAEAASAAGTGQGAEATPAP